MKSSLDKVVVDARQLATRMRARDEAAEGLLGQASWVQSRLDAMRQYQEEVLSMSDQGHQAAGSITTTVLVGFTAENRELDELRVDNEELRCALDEHQAALELIMTKYRDQISSMMRSGEVNTDSPSADDPMAISRMMDRLHQLSHMIRQTNSEGESHSAEMDAVVQQLLTENQGLRQLLDISRQHRVTLVPSTTAVVGTGSIGASSNPPSVGSANQSSTNQGSANDSAADEDALAALNSVVNSLSDEEEEDDSSSSASSTINLSASQSSVSSVSSVATVAAVTPEHSDDDEEPPK